MTTGVQAGQWRLLALAVIAAAVKRHDVATGTQLGDEWREEYLGDLQGVQGVVWSVFDRVGAEISASTSRFRPARYRASGSQLDVATSATPQARSAGYACLQPRRRHVSLLVNT